MRVQYVLSEIATGLRRNLTMTIALVIVVAISIAMFGTGLLVRSQAETTKGYWYDRIEISVFMCNEYSTGAGCADGAVTDAQRDTIRQTLEAHPEVDEVFYENQEQAFERFREQFDDSDVENIITPDQLPESFRVALQDPEEYDGVVSAVSGLPGVQEVTDQRQLLEPLFQTLDGVQVSAFAITLIQVIAAVLLIGNTIRLAAFSRRRETGIMRLVGASNFYIQLPFILEAAIAGLLGSLFGVVALFFGVELVVGRFIAPNLQFTSWVDSGDVWAAVPWLLLAGVLISVVASFVTLRRYLRV
ncbi:permease-like cell division protein FtsX [Jiangella asiatica]|uniref:Cell division protein FtsX n=1 Tax=Jiangella asiatica TaxID=2530372 RepID=A0A4R5DUH3_9ACTN|nr:permease-like cell division protein FtsX [Jiangella asiatica]TDE15970.1 ABC transporter permease [Jiangella asiatica]